MGEPVEDKEAPIDAPVNPYDSRQKRGCDKTLKWCAWEVLTGSSPLSEDDIVQSLLAQGFRQQAKVSTVR